MRTPLDMAVAFGKAAASDTDRIDSMSREELVTLSKEAITALLHLSAAVITEHNDRAFAERSDYAKN